MIALGVILCSLIATDAFYSNLAVKGRARALNLAMVASEDPLLLRAARGEEVTFSARIPALSVRVTRSLTHFFLYHVGGTYSSVDDASSWSSYAGNISLAIHRLVIMQLTRH